MATREPVPGHPGIARIVGTYKTVYAVTVDVGRDPETGARRQRSRRFDTLRAAEDWRINTLHQRREGSYVEASDQPLGAYLTEWLASLQRPGDPSRLAYANHVKRIRAVLDAVPLADLTPVHVDRLTAALVAHPYAPRTVHETLALLKRALARAVRRGQLATNPAAVLDLPPVRRQPLTVWSGSQARQFLAATADESDGPLWQLAIATGMRQSEIVALTWSAIDLDAARLTVERHLTKDRHGRLVMAASAKTESGYRALGLPVSVVGALRVQHYRQAERREIAGAGWCELGLVFDRGDGGRQTPMTLVRRFQRRAAAAGLPVIRFHDLRHTAASLLLTEARLPLFTVSRILGHANIQTTANLYGWLLDDAQRAAAVEIERVLWGLPDLDL